MLEDSDESGHLPNEIDEGNFIPDPGNGIYIIISDYLWKKIE